MHSSPAPRRILQAIVLICLLVSMFPLFVSPVSAATTASPIAVRQVQAIPATDEVIGFEDFDGGEINLTSTSNVFDFDAGGGTGGDVFGRVDGQLGGTGMPYDLGDDTVVDVSGARAGSAYPTDTRGIAGQYTTAFFGMNDMDAVLVNDAVWSFSGWSGTATLTNIEIDIAGLGDFEASSSDGFTIEAQVDGGGYQTIFQAVTDEDASKTYRLMDSGTTPVDTNDPLELYIDGVASGIFLDKCVPETGAFDTYASTLLSGQTASQVDIRVSWAGAPSGSEPMGIDNITINATVVPAVEVLGYEDYDGGDINLSSTSNVFDFDAGGGTGGDVFGRVDGQLGGTGMPYDLGDDTIVDVSGARAGSAYPTDTRGIAGQYTTAFFGMNDMDAVLVNDAIWSFSGWSGTATLTNIEIDIAGLGDFEASSSDGFTIEAQVDGGGYQTIFQAITDEDASKTYRLMDSGTTPVDTNDPLELYIDGVASGTFLDKCIPETGAFDTYTSTLLSGQTASQVDIRVSWAGAPSGSEPMGIDNITINGTLSAAPDTTPPVVQSFTPADDSTDILPSDDLVVTFNENVQKGTGNITIHLASDNSIVETIDVTDAAVTVTGSTVTINPTSDLSDSTEYYVQITAGAIEDLATNAFAGIVDTTTWNFTTGLAPVIATIYEIQGTTASSPYADQLVTTEGIVTGVFYNGYFIQESAGGARSGLWVYDTTNTPAEGDRLSLTGTVVEYNNLTELSSLTAYAVASSGNPVPAPEVLATNLVNDEDWEGVLVQVQNVTVTNPDLGFGEWSVSDGSGDVVVDDKGSYTYTPVAADPIISITGPLDYSYGAFKIQPRDDEDIVQAVTPTTVLSIMDIQGSGAASPHVGATVETTGTVTGFFEGNTSSGSDFDGFFIQNFDGDGDASTSDGLFVNVGSLNPTLSVGDLISVTGVIGEMSEYGDPAPETVTQMSVNNLANIIVQTSGNSVTGADLVPDGTLEYFEAREGMYFDLGTAAYPAPVVGPTSYGTFYVVRADEGVSRVLRNTVHEGTVFGVRNWLRNGSGTDNLINGSTVESGLVGPLTYSFGAYMIAHQDIASASITAASVPSTVPGWATAGPDQISFASFNTYNFDNTGTELDKAVMAIVNMGCPTFVGLEEIDMDAALPALISALLGEGCAYASANSHEDIGGHGVAAIYRTDRVSIVDISTAYQGCSVFGSTSSVAYDNHCDAIADQYPLFSRRPVVITATVTTETATALGDISSMATAPIETQNITFIANHFKSKLGGADADQRRLEQAQLVAGLVDAIVAANPDQQVVVVGDLNDFEDSAPLAALTASGNLNNLWFQLAASERYSYVYNGTSQVLDHILVTSNMLTALENFSPLHHNSDFPYVPYAYDDTVIWRGSDHDPVASTFSYDGATDVSLASAQAMSSMQAAAAGVVVALGSAFTWLRRKLRRS